MAAPTITDSVIATGTGTSVTTGNLTIASGDVLYVDVLLSDGSPGGMTSVTSSGGGGALSSIADSTAVQSFLRCHIWRSTSPTAGTVTITATPAASTGEIAVIAVSVAGVDSGTPNGTVVFADGNGTADAASGSVSSGTDALVLDFHGRFLDGTASMTAGGAQTILEQANYNAILSAGASTEAGAATVVTDWTRGGQGTISNWQWVIGALSINGATGGSATLTCDAAAYVLTAQAVTFTEAAQDTGGFVVGSATSYVGEGFVGAGEAPAGDPVLVADPATYSISAQAVGFPRGRKVAIDPAAYVWTASSATLDYSLTASAASYVLTGQAVTLTYGGADPTIAIDPATYTLTAQAVGLRAGRRTAANPAAYALTGQDVTLTYDPAAILICDAGSFVVGGQIVDLRYSGLAAGNSGEFIVLARRRGRR